METSDVKRALKKLPDRAYSDTMVELFDTYRPPEVQKSIIKRLGRKGKVQAQYTPVVKGVAEEGSPAWPSTSGVRKSKPAGQVPFIYRGDMIPEDELVFFDVEMLSLKPKGSTKHENVASSVAIIDDSRELLLWSYIKWNDSDVCSYYPTLTGISKEKLENGMDIRTISKLTEIIFNRNIVVGYNIASDLKALGVSAPRMEDLAFYFVDSKNQPYSIRDLISHFFNKSVQCGIHSSIQDSRLTRDLYYKKKELESKYPRFQMYDGEVQRTKSQWIPSAEDKCTCPKAWKIGGKKKKPSKAVYSCYEFDDSENSD